MSRRTQAEWLSLIHAFEASGLPQTEFCRSQGINAKYFSKRKNDFKNQTSSSPFVQVRREARAIHAPRYVCAGIGLLTPVANWYCYVSYTHEVIL